MINKSPLFHQYYSIVYKSVNQDKDYIVILRDLIQEIKYHQQWVNNQLNQNQLIKIHYKKQRESNNLMIKNIQLKVPENQVDNNKKEYLK